MRTSLPLVILISLAIVLGCGGKSGSGSGSGSSSNSNPPSGANVLAIAVNSGPLNNYANGVFATVTVCVPGTPTCQTVNSVLVDTGSYGLRVLSSALNGLALPQQNATGSPLVECAQFADGVTWGPVKSADVKLAGEQASSIPIQVIGDPQFPDTSVPTGCSNKGTPQDTQQKLLTNGILGVGPFREDCGQGCAVLVPPTPGVYYACPSGAACTETAVTIPQQVQNPVWKFAVDNNGVIVELPSVPDAGAPSVNGSLIFGIGTQSNNGLGSAKIFTMDSTGNFTTVYPASSQNPAQQYKSFFDTGSNGIFFLDTATTGISSTCPSSITGFYCPSAPVSVSTTQQGANSTSNPVTFKVANAATLFSGNNFAFNDLAGPNPNTFDWGLPFFFGRNVYTAIQGQSTPGGTGPYWAY